MLATSVAGTLPLLPVQMSDSANALLNEARLSSENVGFRNFSAVPEAAISLPLNGNFFKYLNV